MGLICLQVVSNEADEAEIDVLKDIGMKIASKCDGLPLAVKVMGGLLRQKERNINDWKKVLDDSAWSVSGMPEELNYAIYISYKNMSSCVKQCFLHYSLILKDKLIDDGIIIGMWISEGFLHEEQLSLARGTKELEEVGRKCYMELIELNLIEPDELYIDQDLCTMHDVVRSFGQYMCRDEALVGHIGETSIRSILDSQKFLRLSIENRGSESGELEWSILEAQKSLRTLILIGQLNIKPSDSLIAFSSLWTLHLESANVAPLIDSLDQLKHLRYLSIRCSDLSELPENIGKMRLLQLINLGGCEALTKLPGSIVKLGQLRYLNLIGTSTEYGIPRGFSGLTNMRKLYGFSTQVNSNWCSLEELGPLSQLRALGVYGLENVSSTSSITNARFGEKVHLTNLSLNCSSIMGDDGLVSEEEQRRIEEVFDEICPPPSLGYLDMKGYYGQRLPRWMMSTPAAHLKSLRTLIMFDLACCTQLPDVLCQLPVLKSVQINRAPAIKRVGSEFLNSQAAIAFPRLVTLLLVEMVEWEDWEWGEQVRAFPILDLLVFRSCKLRRVPPGLASHARALRRLCIQYVQHISSLENLASVDDLEVYGNPDLERIANLPRLHKLTIVNCPKMKELEGLPALQRLRLEDYNMDKLPEYLCNVHPRHLELVCSLALLTFLAPIGPLSQEWSKLIHIKDVMASAKDGDNQQKWFFVKYTRDDWNFPVHFSISTNISHSSIIACKET